MLKGYISLQRCIPWLSRPGLLLQPERDTLYRLLQGSLTGLFSGDKRHFSLITVW
jgi:hypothetical protein